MRENECIEAAYVHWNIDPPFIVAIKHTGRRNAEKRYEKSYYLAMHDWNRQTDEREWSTAYCARIRKYFLHIFFPTVLYAIFSNWFSANKSYG